MKKIILALIISVISIASFAQSKFPDIDPKWDKYYNENPSGIEQNYQASDFIRVMRIVGYVSRKYNQQKFETALLGLEQRALKQMMIDGSYYSRLYKHDDYFLLYNKYYKTINKNTWDRYCPYLIPLMSFDEIISTR